MEQRTWLITCVSSGFGYEMAKQLLEKGDKAFHICVNMVVDVLSRYHLMVDRLLFQAILCTMATKFGIEGFCESVAQEVSQFNIGVTLVEPGGARTEFRYVSAKVANLMLEYESCHGFLNMLDPTKGLAAENPVKIASHIIESVDQDIAPMTMVLVSQALRDIIKRLQERIEDYETQTDLAESTDYIE